MKVVLFTVSAREDNNLDSSHALLRAVLLNLQNGVCLAHYKMNMMYPLGREFEQQSEQSLRSKLRLRLIRPVARQGTEGKS